MTALRSLAEIDAELKAIADRWEEFPIVGTMPDGEAIRDVPDFGHSVKEPSGYWCTPIAYSVRKQFTH